MAFTSDLFLKVVMGQAMEMARGANKVARRKRGALRDGGTGWLVCFSKFLTFVYHVDMEYGDVE